MKAFLKEFLLRGLVSAGGGPVVLAIIYGCLGAAGTVDSLSPREACLGILTITLLAFLCGGMTAIYRQEKLPLPWAIGIHGTALYAAYILIYLVNGWLSSSLVPILVFTAIFLGGYCLIWAVIFLITRDRTRKLNKLLQDNP